MAGDDQIQNAVVIEVAPNWISLRLLYFQHKTNLIGDFNELLRQNATEGGESDDDREKELLHFAIAAE
jgi:hypothetical protein